MPAVEEVQRSGSFRKVKPRKNGKQTCSRQCFKKPTLVFTRNKGPTDFISDESDADQQSSKARISSRRHSLGLSTENRALAPDRLSLSSNAGAALLPPSIPNSSLLEHIATSRFFHHYVSQKGTFVRLDLDFTSSVIANATTRSTLAEVVIALGILTMPNKTQASRLAAQCRYARALRFTNKVLANKEQAKSDEALMAVILLGLYETTPDESHTMTSWTSHLNGARQLLCIRGREMLKSGATYRMFKLLRSQIEGEERAASELAALFARMCDLNASAKDTPSANPSLIIAEAITLDDELTSWASNLPPEFELSVEPAASATKAYADYYETYCSVFSAEVWMLYRTARIGVNGLILSLHGAVLTCEALLEVLKSEETRPAYEKEKAAIAPQMQKRLDIIEALRVDMCAMVPFLLKRHESQSLPVADLPLCYRTPAINLLLFLTKSPSVSSRIYSWATGWLEELQRGQNVDQGATWMNSSQTGKTVSV